MKAICTTDVSQSIYTLGTANTDLPENTITFNLILPLGTTSSYLTITDKSNVPLNTSTLNLEDNEATYVLNSSYYMSGAGTVKLVVHGSDNFTSREIYIFVEDAFTNEDNIFVETADGGFTIKKIKAFSSGGGGGGGVVKEEDPTVPQHVKDITQSDINRWNNKSDFSGSYKDLTDKPTKVTEFENDAGYVDRTVNDLINYYTRKELYNKDEVDILISKFLKMNLTNGNYSGNCEMTDGTDTFLIQWGRAVLTNVAGQVSSTTIYFPIEYDTTPMVIVNPFTTAIGTAILGVNVQQATPTYFIADILRTNSLSTTIGYISIGKKVNE